MANGRIQEPGKRTRALRVVPPRAGSVDSLAAEALTSPEALEELCGKYAPRMYSYVLKRVGGVQDAEDVTSLVFEKVIGNLGSFDESRASFSTWIYRIATNCITDYYRSRGRRKEAPIEDELTGGVAAAGSDLERVDLHIALLDLLQQLPAKYREAIALRYFAQMRVLEVARTLNITESAASKRILRGLEELRVLSRGGPLEELL